MNKKVKWLTILIISSLVSIILLQSFYAYEVYKQRSMEFDRDVKLAFEQALKRANNHRLEKVNNYFANLISSNKDVRLEFTVKDNEPRLEVVNPKNGYKYLSTTLKKPLDWEPDSLDLINAALEKNWEYLKMNGILYWTVEIGDKLKAYSDSVEISKKKMNVYLREELDAFNVAGDFNYILRDSVESTGGTTMFDTKLRPAKIDGKFLVSITIKNPNAEIFKRIAGILFLTLVVLVLIIISFIYLFMLFQKQKRLAELKDDFIDNVTHEMITPVATLQLALETLSNGKQNPNPSKYIEVAKNHADRIAEVVDQVVKTSFDNDHKSSKLQKVDVNKSIAEILQYFESTSNHSLQIETNFETSNEALANKECLTTALHNVIGNSIKYANKEVIQIKIEVKQTDGHIEISIRDNGPGIEKKHQQLIFEKFHRVPSSSHDVKGLGIGLYFTRKNLRQCKGDITLKDSSSKGSTFCITLIKAAGNEA